MKQCFKCGETKPLAAFYTHSRMADGHLNKCKECTKRDVGVHYQATRPEQALYERKRAQTPDRKQQQSKHQRQGRTKHRNRYLARAAVGNAVKDGRIKKQPCETCGTIEGVEAHHDDYSKPLDVRWLCFAHHCQTHGRQAIPGMKVQNGPTQPV
jgi:hypothetical protein